MKTKAAGLPSHGFTMVEILVTISIILILVAIIIPVTSNVRAKAWEVEAATNMRSIHQAIMLSQLENGGRFPLMKNYSWDGPENPAGGYTAENYPYMQEALGPHLGLVETGDTEIEDIFRSPVVMANQTQTWLHDPIHTHFRYNVMTAPGNYMTDDNKAVVLFDVAWPDWPATDFPYQSGEPYINVVYGSGELSPLPHSEYLALFNGSSESVESPFYANGWANDAH